MDKTVWHKRDKKEDRLVCALYLCTVYYTEKSTSLQWGLAYDVIEIVPQMRLNMNPNEIEFEFSFGYSFEKF